MGWTASTVSTGLCDMQVMVALIPPRSRNQGMLTSLFLERIFHPFSPTSSLILTDPFSSLRRGLILRYLTSFVDDRKLIKLPRDLLCPFM
jgi:hypothetical protein